MNGAALLRGRTVLRDALLFVIAKREADLICRRFARGGSAADYEVDPTGSWRIREEEEEVTCDDHVVAVHTTCTERDLNAKKRKRRKETREKKGKQNRAEQNRRKRSSKHERVRHVNYTIFTIGFI